LLCGLLTTTPARADSAAGPGDANASPSGGERTLFYRLTPGEAGWLLQLENSVDSR
jgi:hypothetical protein